MRAQDRVLWGFIVIACLIMLCPLQTLLGEDWLFYVSLLAIPAYVVARLVGEKIGDYEPMIAIFVIFTEVLILVLLYTA